MKVLLFARYGSLGASSRVRHLQYLPWLAEQGVHVRVEPLFSNKYVKKLYAGQHARAEVLKGYLRRLWLLFIVRRFDLLIIEKELFPFLPAFAERLLKWMGVRYLVDYDDALFHRYDLHGSAAVRRLLGRKIDVVMNRSALVIAGNDYLAQRARDAGADRVRIVPTVVDCERYQPAENDLLGDRRVVGWIGTPQTSRYLTPLLPVFERLQKLYRVKFVAVGANPDDFSGTPVEAWPWSEESEVSSIQMFDIGIMPLVDSPWERGKCGYKLVQYMACSVPVVGSPVGVNVNIVKPGINGYLAESETEWFERLSTLLQDPNALRRLGEEGRKQVESCYSLQAQAPRLLSFIEEAAGPTAARE